MMVAGKSLIAVRQIMLKLSVNLGLSLHPPSEALNSEIDLYGNI
jgi:hypothetical protein